MVHVGKHAAEVSSVPKDTVNAPPGRLFAMANVSTPIQNGSIAVGAIKVAREASSVRLDNASPIVPLRLLMRVMGPV